MLPSLTLTNSFSSSPPPKVSLWTFGHGKSMLSTTSAHVGGPTRASRSSPLCQGRALCSPQATPNVTHSEMKKHRPNLAPTIPGIFIQAVAREGFLGAAPRDYPYSVPAIRRLTELRFEAPVTFSVRVNGSGRSTLLKPIATAFGLNPEGRTKQ